MEGKDEKNNEFFKAVTNADHPDRVGKVDSKDTVVLYVNSDDSEGVTEGNIDLAYVFDSDFCTATKTATTQGAYTKYTISGLSEDNAPNVKAYFDDNDQITVLVVDVNRNITQW